MGQYTELKTNFHLKSTTPTEVIDILLYIADKKTELPDLPEHPLFACHRWTLLFNSTSAYFDYEKFAEINNNSTRCHIKTQSNFKNYDREIQQFWDWILPYIDSPPGEQLGEITYDYDTIDLVFMGDSDNLVFIRQDKEREPGIWGGMVVLYQNITIVYFILNGIIAIYELIMFFYKNKIDHVVQPVYIHGLISKSKVFLFAMYNFLVNLIFGTVFLIYRIRP